MTRIYEKKPMNEAKAASIRKHSKCFNCGHLGTWHHYDWVGNPTEPYHHDSKCGHMGCGCQDYDGRGQVFPGYSEL